MDDKAIVALYFARDEAAIAESDRKYGESLIRLSSRIVDDHTAQECVNDTYLKSWNTIPPKNPAEYLFAFFAKITRNISLTRYRRNKREKRCEDFSVFLGELTECVPDCTDTHDTLMEGELTALIEKFLNEKKPEARGIFIYRYFFLSTTEETARHFGVSEGKVKSTLFRLRLELKERLKKEGYTVE